MDNDSIGSIGRVDTVYRCLQYHRRNLLTPPPFKYETLKISESLSKTHTIAILSIWV
jgi:hypothetical protein